MFHVVGSVLLSLLLWYIIIVVALQVLVFIKEHFTGVLITLLIFIGLGTVLTAIEG